MRVQWRLTCEGQAPRPSVSISDGMPTTLGKDSLIPVLLYVILCFDQYTTEDKLRVISEFSARRALPPCERALFISFTTAFFSPLAYPVHVRPVSHASASRIGKGEWSCSVVVYGIERIFWIVRNRRSFRPSGIPQARGKRIDDRTYYAIAEYDLGHPVSFETTVGDDVIPRSWAMPYTASAFCF